MQVMGESKRKEEYICFPEHLCTCYSFFYDIVGRGEQLCVSALPVTMAALFIEALNSWSMWNPKEALGSYSCNC
jgi:hypothetical protein